MIGRSLLIVGLALVVFGGWADAGPAQDMLGDMAEAARDERILTGSLTLGVGVALGVASGMFLMGSEFGLYGLVAGSATAVSGAALLLFPSQAESEFARSGDSEAASALALKRLADDGRRGRFLSGITNVATGIVAIVYPVNLFTSADWIYSAVASFGAAIYDFLVPSREEATYERYVALAGGST